MTAHSPSATPSAPDVIVAGNACVDLVCGPLDDPPVKDRSMRVDSIMRDIGGCGANTARSLARLDISVSLVTCVGTDPDGRFIEDVLRGNHVGVDRMVRVDSLPTGLTICLAGRDGGWRSFIHRPGAGADLTPEFIVQRLPEHPFVLHLAGFWGNLPMGGDRSLGLLQEAHRRGAVVTIDMSWSSAKSWQVAPAVLAEADAVFPNADEARAISGRSDPREAAAWFHARGVEVVVITRGAAGALVSSPAGLFDVPAFHVSAADAVGAGDAFAAGFLSEIVRLGFDPEDPNKLRSQARLASAAGALAASGPGGCGQLDSRSRAEDLARSQ